MNANAIEAVCLVWRFQDTWSIIIVKGLMKLYIKNMVCPRCIMSVENLLHEQKLPFSYVKLGEVEIEGKVSERQIEKFGKELLPLGFELLNDPASKIIEKVKSILIQEIQGGIDEHFSLQKFISSKVLKDYSSVSKLFSLVEGITIEQFFILQRVEKAKELLVYNENSMAEIALHLGYSSSQHLSSQFRKVTGMTPTHFKSLGNELRRPIDNLRP